VILVPRSKQPSRRTFLSTAAVSTAATMLGRSSFSLALPKTDLAAFPFSDAAEVASAWRSEGIIQTANSPFAKLHSVPIRAVIIEEGFWSKRRRTNVEHSIPTMHDELEAHGRMENFRRLVGKSSASQIGPYFSDSDIYKWIDAVGWALQSDSLPELRRTTDAMIREVVAVQEPNGYLNTYYQGDRVSLRMTQHDQEVGHEMYCLGHMIQGAIAYYRATGDSTLMDAGMRMVDNFVLPNFGPGPNQKPIISGHPEIEMALIELYRTTGKRQYVDLAGYILHGDRRWTIEPQRVVYMFCGIPFTSRTKLEGHAVRAMYACCGATDYYLETGDQEYWNTLNLLWEDLTRRQMYVTGGVGARSQWEAFGDAYELPNAQAYGESCAAIGNMMWNWRMLAASGEAKFTDVIERALYNGINSGMSLDGITYCYRNPLAFDPSSGEHIRNPWYDVTCCPPNLERTFSALPGYFYSTSKDGLFVHLYDNSTLDWRLENGTAIKVKQTTNYPWQGDIQLTVTPENAAEFTVHVRIPGWANGATVALNGKPERQVSAGAYFPIRRTWQPGDRVSINLPMEIVPLAANPRVAEDRARVAVRRGPIIYCLEGLDQARGVQLADLAISLGPSKEDFRSEYRSDLLQGVMLLGHRGRAFETSSAEEALYLPATASPLKTRPENLIFVPYYAWANRQTSAMQVWIPYVSS
jgi:uncharacterized protein